MLESVFVVSLLSAVHASGVVPIANAPVVTAASSQYFQRTFNRLVAAAPPVLETPVVTVTPAAPPILIQPVVTKPIFNEIIPNDFPAPDPNVAIAVATAHAAPISTLLLPPLPIAPNVVQVFPTFTRTETEQKEEKQKKKQIEEFRKTKTKNEFEAIEPASNNNDLSQLPLETNTNVFNPYGAKPQKFKTDVEIVPVPLAYIAPPPLQQITYKPIKHYSFVPARIVVRPKYTPSRLIIRARAPQRLPSYKSPQKSAPYRAATPIRNPNPAFPQTFVRTPVRDIEPTTFSPFRRPNTKPPRL